MRKIIHIDEDKCDGCGICANACHERAIEIINGKAKLVKDSYCDGLGACIGECPRGALSFVVREADAYDEEAVKKRIAEADKAPVPHCGGCPGSAARTLTHVGGEETVQHAGDMAELAESQLINWPVQLSLVPIDAPYLKGADLLLAADCTAFAYAGFHKRILSGHIALIGCPKLDDGNFYIEKLEKIFKINKPREITVAYMEVPCCGALVRIVREAMKRSGLAVTLSLIKLSVNGTFMEIQTIG